MPTDEFWTSYQIARGSIVSGNWKSSLRQFLSDATPKTVAEVATLVEAPSPETGEEKADAILKAPRAADVACLREFMRARYFAVAEIFGPGRGLIEILTQVVERKTGHLEHVATLAAWGSRARGIRFTSDEKGDWTAIPKRKTLQDALSAIPNLELRHFHYDMKTEVTRAVVGRIAKEKVSPEKGRDRVINPLRPAVIQLDPKNKFLEIRGKLPKKLTNGIRGAVAKLIEVKLTEYDEDEEKAPDLDKFAKFWTDEATDKFVVTSATVRSSKLPGNPELTLRQKDGRDVREALRGLSASESVSIIDPHDLSRFSLRPDDPVLDIRQPRTLKIIRRKDGSIEIDLDTKKLEAAKAKPLAIQLQKDLGVPLDRPISPSCTRYGRGQVIDALLGKEEFSERGILAHELNVARELEKDGLLSAEKVNHDECEECGAVMLTADNIHPCPECRSVRYRTVKLDRFKPVPSAIYKTLHEMIEDGTKIKVTNNSSELTFDGTKYRFFRMTHAGNEHLLFLARERMSDSMVDWLKRTNPALTVVNTGSAAGKSRRDIPQWCNQLNFGERYVEWKAKRITKDYWPSILASERRYSTNAIEQAAAESARSIANYTPDDKEYTERDLEDDTYHILAGIFPRAVRWGKEATGKERPEGLVGFAWKEAGGSKMAACIAWDCKFARYPKKKRDGTGKKREFTLRIDERRKLVDYIETLRRLDEIERLDGKLGAFLVITNAMDQKHFRKAARWIKRKTKWDGTVVLLTMQGLRALHVAFKDSEKELLARRNIFHRRLNELLRAETSRILWLTAAKIRKLVKEVVGRNPELDELDPAAVKEEMDA